MKRSILFAFALTTGNMFAQEEYKPLTVSGYAEMYYLRDFNNPLNNSRPSFVYSHNRHNEVSLNLAFIKATYETPLLRGNLAIATGTYMNANYAAEPDVLKNVYEAYVGIKISRKHNLWIDAGIFPSHIGFESAIGKDNWTLTRSLFADNSPYFETGAKISYTSNNGKWFLSGLVLNGWQRIQRVEGNSTPAFGHQVLFKLNEKLSVNSSSYIGNDKADSIRKVRYFHNLYAIYQSDAKFGITGGFDIGAEQKDKGADTYHFWYTPVLIARYNLTNNFALTARAEYYQDKNGVIVSTGTSEGFKTFGYSINSDYKILPNVLWRMEFRQLQSKDAIFENRQTHLESRSVIAVTALTLSF